MGDIVSKPWDQLPSLSDVQAAHLDVGAAQRLLGRNTQLLAAINEDMIHWTHLYGNAKLELDKMKLTKSTIIEINRALKSIIDNG